MSKDTTKANLSKQKKSVSTDIILPVIEHKDGVTPEIIEALKKMGVHSFCLETGEVFEIFDNILDTPTPPKVRSHKNKLGYIDPTVAGIDIGDKEIYVSIPNDKGGTTVQAFETTTPDLMAIAQAFKKAGVITAVMESTGVYWVPLYEILELQGFNPVLVDAKSVKNVPGRKTDVLDCQWIQVLYSSGLLRAAFRPKQEMLPLRAYMRRRYEIIKTRQVSLCHMEKALQLMNVKLSTAVSDIACMSGLSIMRAIVKGDRNPIHLASLRSDRCKKDESLFIKALTGNFQEEHIFVLQQALEQYDFAELQLKACDQKISSRLEVLPDITNEPLPLREKDKSKKTGRHLAPRSEKNDVSFDARGLMWRKFGIDLTVLPGIGSSTALLIMSELGGKDVSSWKNEKAFASWLKLCPGNNISGGKRRKSKKQPCANYITQALRMAAMNTKKTQTFLGARIRRISGKTDSPRGIKAGAHKLAIMIYFMCREGWEYHEKGVDAYEKADAERQRKRLEKQAKDLGLKLVAA